MKMSTIMYNRVDVDGFGVAHREAGQERRAKQTNRRWSSTRTEQHDGVREQVPLRTV
jgi:hypothetical protein